MVYLFKREKEELYCVEEKNISKIEVISYLESNREKCVYVLKEDVLVGIITYGDCLRYIQEQKDLINRNFKFVYETDKDEINLLVKNYLYLKSIPVLDSDNRILYEFQVLTNEIILWDNGYKQRINNVYKILEECDITELVFVGLYYEYELIKKVFEKYDINTMEVKYQQSYDENKLENNILYVDNDAVRQCKMRMLNNFVQLITTDELFALFLNPNKYIKNISNFVALIGRTYKNIAVYNRNKFTQKLIHELKLKNISFDIITEENFSYCVDNVCGYQLNIKKEYDVVVTGSFDVLYTPLYYKSKRVYNLVSLFRGYVYHLNDFNHALQEVDIINNILPNLIKQGVKVIVIETPDGKYIQRLHMSSIAKYGLTKEWVKIFGCEPEYLLLPGYFKEGFYQFSEYNSKNFNIGSGIRKTINNEIVGKKKIFFVGSCQPSGLTVDDSNTIASHLTRFLKKDYEIYNCVGYPWQTPWTIRKQVYMQGDILVLFTLCGEIYRQSGYNIESVLCAYEDFKENEDNVIWDNRSHSNGEVNKKIAKRIYEICLEREIIKEAK